MTIVAKNPKFITSAQHIAQAPNPQSSEIAFLGRSNVGKSSLLNMLLGKKLAKSSATPGKTRLINFFSVVYEVQEDSQVLEHKVQTQEYFCNRVQVPLVFIDLPGFGYAKVSKETKAQWDKHLLEFLQKRSNIKLFIHLRDSRHPNLHQDNVVLEFLQNLKRADQEILTIYTKADKLTQSQLQKLKGISALLVSTQSSSKIQGKILDSVVLRSMLLQRVLGQK